jgi:peptidoglycan hydrolase-like protein with peptidoglycan-binding domain
VPTYKNGQVPRSAMKAFRNTGKYGHPDFINRLDQAFTAVQRELGVALYIGSGQDIMRDYSAQVYWKNYWTQRGKPGNAAAPGFSNHGLGVCADISPMPARGTASFNRIAAVFARYNIHFNYTPENWHVQDLNISVAGNQVTINAPAKSFSGNPYFPSIDAFKQVQNGYNVLGYGLTVDGLVGPKTTAATRDFQSKHGLVVDGIHGPGTEKVLVAAVAAKQPSAPPASGGNDIKAVVRNQQSRLNVWGAATPPLAVDGIPGPKFVQATKVFQKAHGMTQDGKIGPQTWALLQQNPPAPAPAPAPAPRPSGPVPPLLPGSDIKTAVKNQQMRLNVWGAATPPLIVDGIPGPKFVQATKVFQKARGIAADGKIGPQTWALLIRNP